MDNDSNSSVESCNSARFFSTGKKRNNFQQQLVIGSKRVKIDNEETSGSKSYIKQESSFRNWISSMVKGLSQSTQDDSNTLAVSLANPNLHNAWFDEKVSHAKRIKILSRKIQDSNPFFSPCIVQV
ncbi:putative RNA polymerase-associated protein Rtf1 [Medicago truncatula]|uniref:Putative RNA polymerase-associated protein Rtf1 n=1 Tax=Medicago truncatula TaxID=3880 RepID=A0A396HHV2_MEDTR|nr:putative RNA polymerase-associated protein Rtf1 [Medicago truncatula]